MSADIPQRWVKQGLYDLETARVMTDSGRFLYVPFCCQQAVEKLIKAVIAKVTGEMPPRSHNLVQLSKLAGLEPDAAQTLLMRELTEYYVQSRYPDEIDPNSLTQWEEVARDLLQRTETICQWLSTTV